MSEMTTEEELVLIHRNKAPDPATPAITAPDAPPRPAPKTAAEIDAELGLPPRETGLAPLPAEDPDFLEVMGAAWRRDTITTDAWNAAAKMRVDLVAEMYSLLPDSEKAIVGREFVQGVGWAKSAGGVVAAAARVAAQSQDGAARWAQYPLTADALDQRVDADRLAEVEEAEAIMGQPGGGVAEFIGSGARAMTDETSLMLMPLGVKGSFLRRILAETALGAAGEAAILPKEYRVARELGLPDPDPVSRVALGAVFGGGLFAGLEGLGRGMRALTTKAEARRASLKETIPDGVDRIDHEAALDAAEATLRGDQTPQERLGLAGGARAEEPSASALAEALAKPSEGVLPPASAGGVVDAAEWGPVRNGIFAGESGGDYNALFGYQNRKGGKFSNVKLTEMTVDQAIAFSDPSGAYGQWVKGQIGRVATPMGAYQIVGTTLRGLKRDLGLKGDEVMTAEFQEFLGQHIYLRQGTGAWEGYKGPRDSYTPGSVDGPAPDMGGTSRGYTGWDQVAVGDNMRIDVDYEVVDYRSLIRASGDLQPRDRSRINSDEWVAATAARLDPAQLMPSPTADRGTPIVGPDNVIESGNGRSMAIARAYERHPDRAEAYRGAIEAAGYQIPEGVDQPVLIARRRTELSPDQRRRLVIDAQDSGVAQMTPTEVARAASQGMTAPILSRLDPTQPITSDANGDFVRSALATLPRSARNAMFDPNGALNASGQRQLREALFARAWDDPGILARYTEGAPAELKSLMEALETAAPSWAALKADIEAGLVAPEMDISPFVMDAMRLIGAARDIAGKSGLPIAKAVAELIDEVDLIEGAISPLTAALVRKMWQGKRAAPADEVASFLTRYADEARDAGRAGGMFDAPTPRDVLRTIDKETFGNLPEDLGQPRGFARPGNEAPPEAVADKGLEDFDQGAQSPMAEAVHAEIEAELRAPAAEPFGPVYEGFSGDPEGAIAHLLAQKTGEVTDAFAIPGGQIGNASLVYGNDRFGLRHIQLKHPEMIDRLPDLLRKGRVVTDPEGQRRLYIVDDADPANAATIRLDWDGADKRWLVTAYQDDWGKFARDRKEAYRTDLTDTRDPASSGKGQDTPSPARAQDAPPAPPNARPVGSDGIAATTGIAENASAPARGLLERAKRFIDPVTRAIDKARRDLGDFADMEIDLDDGTTARARDFLDDLDSDRAADAVLQACGISPGGAQ